MEFSALEMGSVVIDIDGQRMDARFLRDTRRSTAWWALGMVALVLFTVAFYPSVKGNEAFDKLKRGE